MTPCHHYQVKLEFKVEAFCMQKLSKKKNRNDSTVLLFNCFVGTCPIAK